MASDPPPSATPREPPTIGRAAFFGGLGIGALIAIAGFYAISALGVSGVLALPFELAVVLAAMLITRLIWAKSAQRSPGVLDTPDGDRDRGEK